jgi:hypothetical protein
LLRLVRPDLSTCPFFLIRPPYSSYLLKRIKSTDNPFCYHHEEIFKLRLYTKVDYKTEVLSGLTVALALIPEVAFALIAGLSPLTGLYAAFVVGLVTSILEATWNDFRSYRCNRSCNVALAISHGLNIYLQPLC